MAVYDGLPVLKKQEQLIRDAVDRQVPLLGICLGSQLIAKACGGKVFRGPAKEIGWYDINLTPRGTSGIFNGIKSERIRVFQWHGDTYELPPNANVLAFSRSRISATNSGSLSYCQAFNVGMAFGLQFHVEVTPGLIKKFAEQYASELRQEGINKREILAESTKESHDLANYCKVIYSNFSKFIRRSK